MTVLAPLSPAPQAAPRGNGRFLAIFYVALALLIFGGLGMGGTAASFASIGLTVMPFMLLATLAYLGRARLSLKLFTLVWMGLLLSGMALVYVAFSALPLMGSVMLGGGSAAVPELDPGTLAQLAPLALVAFGTLMAMVIGLLGIFPAVRRFLSRMLPLDPNSFVHTVALITIVGVTLMGYIPLLVLGEPPLLSAAVMESLGDLSTRESLLAQIYTLVWAIPAALLVVGVGVQRDLGQALRRLGFVRPTGRQLLIALVATAVLVVAVHLLDLLLTGVWGYMGWPTTDEEAFGELLAFALSPVGAVVIGVTAGVGEELGVRGVLQPRLGLILSNLFFTSLHALQYNWDALLVVFLVGMVLGVLRNRTNTSTCAIVHGLYDFVLIMMAVYGISLFGP